MYAAKLFVGLNAEEFVNGAQLYRFAAQEAQSTPTETWHNLLAQCDQ